MFFNLNDPLQLLLFVLTINVLVTAVSLIMALKLTKDKRPRLGVAGSTLLPVGLIALLSSIFLESSTLAFIGLGLTFWGALLLYVTSERYVKQALLGSTTISSLINLNQILNELKYQGATTYLPSKYFKDLETTKVYISKYKNNRLPKPEEIQQQEDKTFLMNPEAVLLIPLGLALSKLVEKKLGTSFTKLDLEQLQQDLPKILIEDLELAENFEIQIKLSEVSKGTNKSDSLTQTKDELIHVKITNSIFEDLCKEVLKTSTSYPICKIGCPLCSAIACTLAQTIGRPITIEMCLFISEDAKIIETIYQVLETEEGQELVEGVS